MFRWMLLAVALLCAPAVSFAQDGVYRPGLPVTDTNPPPAKCVTWNGSAYVACGGGSTSATPTGTAGTPNANVVTVQGISGGFPQPVSSTQLPATLGAKTSAASVSLAPATDAVFQHIQQPGAAAVNAIVPQASAALTAGQVAKASAGNVFRVSVTTGATAGYLLGFNSTTIPADGAVTPVMCRAIGPNATLSVSFADMPSRWGTGITFVFSSTGCFTKTGSATAYMEWSVI